MSYRVDWTDPAFPRIMITDDPEDTRSFQECKREIREHFQYLADHAKDRLQWIRALKEEK